MRVDHRKPTRWRRWTEDAAAWLLIASAAYAGALLALLTWRALVG